MARTKSRAVRRKPFHNVWKYRRVGQTTLHLWDEVVLNDPVNLMAAFNTAWDPTVARNERIVRFVNFVKDKDMDPWI